MKMLTTKMIRVGDLAPLKDPQGGKKHKKNLKGDPAERPDPVILPPFFTP